MKMADLPSGIFVTRGRQFVAGMSTRSLAFFWKRRKLFLALFFAFLVLLLLGAALKAAIFIVILTVVASVSMYYKRFFRFTFGFELVTFSTVLVTVAYGPMIGAVVGFVSAVAAEVLPQMIDSSSFFWIISVPVSAFVVSFMFGIGVPLFWLGFVSLAVQFMISEPIRIFSGDQYLKSMGIVNIVTTSAWALLWFRFLAPVVLSMM